ncbi:hypothetical protein ACQ4PT_002941 [Festuca glaucescens]
MAMGIMVMSMLWSLVAALMIATVRADDEAALLAFRAQLSDGSYPTLASWNNSAHFCSWEGVMCSHRRPARVVELRLNSTGLTGELSPAIGNLTFLRTLDLSFNWLNREIPASLGRLHRLQRLYLNDNAFSGMFPANLSSCANMIIMGVHNNKLGRRIPGELGEKLMSLAAISLSNNSFIGPIPASLANLSYLQNLDLSYNQLVGSIPPGLSHIHSIWRFSIFSNNLSGMIPPSLYNWSSLEFFEVGVNMLYGSIPDDISDKLSKMKVLGLGENHFTGPIPSSISNLSYLTNLRLSKNRFSGYVPPTLGRLGSLQKLDLDGNKLEVNNSEGWEFISSLANCSQLERLSLGGDSFGGQLPGSIVNLSTTLQKFYLMDSGVSGGIPADIGNLVGLNLLAIVNTSISGVIPESIGEVPHGGVFRNITYIAVAGNINLCGGTPQIHLPPCSTSSLLSKKRKKMSKPLVISLATTGAILLSLSLIFVVWILRQKLKRRQKGIVQSINAGEQYERNSYQALFTGTNGFSEANLLGKGSHGAVYKCDLDSADQLLAAKVFNPLQSGSSKSFQVECEAMRRIRHRCLTKIITCCSSVDDKGQEFKALVFEFMPNGNLDGWLHPRSQEPTKNNTLSLAQRLDIATDIMDAVEYLHNYCQPPVIHCDLKPSNILLTEDMSARVGDFGISRIFQENTSNRMQASYSSTVIRGSIGYVAPEYGEGSMVSSHGDIYSLGILLLEMFTGRSPTDDTFRDSLDLHKFAEDALSKRTLEIADPTIWLHREPKDKITSSRIQECLVSVFRLSISCSKKQPLQRTLIRDAAVEMHAIRDAYLVFDCELIQEHRETEEPLLKTLECMILQQ